MGHKFPNVLVHIVFSTKSRRNLIPQELLPKLWSYFNGIGTKTKISVLMAGGTSNHSHILVALPSDVSVAKAVQTMKANSSRWLGQHGIEFAWQEGYGAFSVSASNVGGVKRYIARQQEHHRKRSFEDEFLLLLQKSGVQFDPAGVFD